MTVRKLIALMLVAGSATAFGACSEKLTGGAACPRLCPGQNLQILDTTFRVDLQQPVFDTTVSSYPLLGREGALLSATIPGRVLVRAIIRFDSMPHTYKRATTDTTVYPVDTVHNAALWFLVTPSTVRATRGSDLIQFQVYNVDTAGADTSVLVLNSLLRPDRYLGGSKLFTAAHLSDTAGNRVDTIVVPLDTAMMLRTLQSARRNVRTAIVAAVTNSATDGVTLNINEQTLPFIRWFASDSIGSKDTTTFARVSASPRSTEPVTDSSLLNRLIHYPLIVQGAGVDSGSMLNIGGMPARRVYLRFRLPSHIIDSANVIRATLLLTPRPQPVQIPADTAVVYPRPVVASAKILEPATAALFAVSSALYGLDSVKIDPTARKRAAFDFVNAVRNWQNVSDTLNTRSLVLQVLDEGATPLETSFWSSLAPDTANRPHVRVQYVKRSPFALP